MSVEILIAVIASSGTILAAIVGLMGRRDESATKAASELIGSQGERISKLEGRLDAVESNLREAREELQAMRWHAGDLRDALRRALAWIAEAMEHLQSPETISPPSAPDIAAWQALVESPPRARNPPD